MFDPKNQPKKITQHGVAFWTSHPLPGVMGFTWPQDQKGIIKLADALQENKSLRVLRLSKNGITQQAQDFFRKWQVGFSLRDGW